MYVASALFTVLEVIPLRSSNLELGSESDVTSAGLRSQRASDARLAHHTSPRSLDMPKGNKSSASAGTRKKHAKKSDKDNNVPPSGPQQKSKKLTKAEKKAKVKQYIPPPKPPAPSIPDPLDSQGLAHTLPPELVVILRRIGKKDVVTKRKGLEELREDWVIACRKEVDNEDEEVEREIKESALVSSVPLWVSEPP